MKEVHNGTRFKEMDSIMVAPDYDNDPGRIL